MNRFMSELVWPLSWDKFLATAWAKNHVYFQACGRDRFADLFGWKDLNRILEQCRLPAPRMRLYKNGAEVDRDSYSHSSGHERIIHAEDVESCVASGGTLIIDEVDELHTPLRHLAVSLEEEFRTPVNINAYASWKATPGFDPHWDEQDVFIIQLAGRKNWRVHAPQDPNPIRAQQKYMKPPPGEAVFERVLSAGDVLYLPRGWWHLVTPVNEASLHLTVGINTVMTIELLQWLAHSLRGEQALRQRLDAWTGQTAKALQDLLSELLTADLVEQFQRERGQRASRRQWFSFPHLAAPRIADLPPNAAIRNVSPRGTHIGRSDSSGCFDVIAGDSRWLIPDIYRAAIHRLTSFEPTRICDLKQQYPPSDWPFLEQLIQQWLDKRLLRVAAADVTCGAEREPATNAWSYSEEAVGAAH